MTVAMRTTSTDMATASAIVDDGESPPASSSASTDDRNKEMQAPLKGEKLRK